MIRALLPVSLLLVAHAFGAQAKTSAPLPVSVSSANYAETSDEQLFEFITGDLQHNPAARPLQKLERPRRYVFAPGQLAESDIPFKEVCRRLAAALARKGFVSAADEHDVIREPDRIDLILRVHCGQRNWRLPVVRRDHLTWRAGLTDDRRQPESILSSRMEVAYDYRAGGDDSALGQAGAAQDRAASSGQASGSSNASFNPVTGYDATREFNLIVVDAFDYHELLTKKAAAKRLWTTFVAVPVDPDQKFSDVLNTMLRVATPYFGENTKGLQMFDDARANVQVGPTEVIESDVKLSAGDKR